MASQDEASLTILSSLGLTPSSLAEPAILAQAKGCKMPDQQGSGCFSRFAWQQSPGQAVFN